MMSKDSFVIGVVVGIIIGCIVLFFASKIRKKEIYKIFINENGIENFLVIASAFLFIIAVIIDTNEKVVDLKITSATISFVGTFLFSFLLTKRYSKKTYTEELKDVATTAYRHNKSLLTKIIYEIDLIDRIFSKNTCNGGDKNLCEYTHTLYRMRDSLVGFKRDAEENINDWSNIIPEEINAINEVISTQKKIYDLEYIMSNTEDDIDLDRFRSERIKLENNLAIHQHIIEKNPMLKIILENDKKLAEEMENYIKTEEDAKASQTMKQSRSYENMKPFYKTK